MITMRLAACLVAITVAACGSPPPVTTTYEPFEPASYQSARAPLEFYSKVRSLGSASGFGRSSFGTFDVDFAGAPDTRCTPRATPAAETIASAFLIGDACKQVLKLVERHPYGTGSGTTFLGEAIHKEVVTGIQAGAIADDDVALDVASERVKKSMLRYFYESVVDGTLRRSPRGWDQAFASWGNAMDGQGAFGLSLLAQGRDKSLKTTFEKDIFAMLLNGRRILGQRGLTGDDSLKAGGSTELDKLVDDIDATLQLLFAHYGGGEFVAWQTEVSDRPAKYVEGSLIVRAIADAVKAKNPTQHAALMAALDKQTGAFSEADAQTIVRVLETTYGIQIVAE